MEHLDACHFTATQPAEQYRPEFSEEVLAAIESDISKKERHRRFSSITAKLALPLTLLALGGSAETAPAVEKARTSPVTADSGSSLNMDRPAQFQVVQPRAAGQHLETGAQDDGAVMSGDPVRIERALTVGREMGATWWRLMVHPKDVATDEDKAEVLAVAERVKAHGYKLNVAASGEGVKWTRKSVRRYMRDMASLLNNKADSLAIFNEPNYENKYNQGWLIRIPGMTLPETYGYLYRQAQAELEDVAPELEVWFGELNSRSGKTPKEGWRTSLQFFEKSVACPSPRKKCRPIQTDAFTYHPYSLDSSLMKKSQRRGEYGMSRLADINAKLFQLYLQGKIQTPEGDMPPLRITEIAWLAKTRQEDKKLAKLERAQGRPSGIRNRFKPEQHRAANYIHSLRIACGIANVKSLSVYGIETPHEDWPGWFNAALIDSTGRWLPTAHSFRRFVVRHSECVKTHLNTDPPVSSTTKKSKNITYAGH